MSAQTDLFGIVGPGTFSRRFLMVNRAPQAATESKREPRWAVTSRAEVDALLKDRDLPPVTFYRTFDLGAHPVSACADLGTWSFGVARLDQANFAALEATISTRPGLFGIVDLSTTLRRFGGFDGQTIVYVSLVFEHLDH